jgi:8-oxo-dGTP pyrophosphatase MutT (NUDIX family)
MRNTHVHSNSVFASLSEKLAFFSAAPDPCAGDRTPAAVAMILHQDAHDVEILFIQRASHDLDPWSGHVAFPGGKLEVGEVPCEAACRETLEEIGIDLIEGTYLGRLSDIIGANLPVRVSCCLFAVDKNHIRPVLNEEVHNLFWVALADLRDPERHATSPVAFDDKTFDVPAIKLPVENMPVLWGITYRLVMQLLHVLEDDRAESVECSRLPETVELNEED